MQVRRHTAGESIGAKRPAEAQPASARGSALGRRRWPFVTTCAVACLLVLGAYSNSLDNAFHFDDSHVIENNLYIHSLRNIPRFFTDAHTFSSVPMNATYRPVISTTLAIDYRLGGGLVPRAFHVTQVLLLAITGVMLGVLSFRILSSGGGSPWHRWTALIAATLFCVHTGNTQTVNYISSRSELLSGIGVLGALLVYSCGPRARRYQLHLVPMAFGALAKTPAVMAAPLLLAYDLFIERQLSVREVFTRRAWPRTRAALLATAPAFLLGIALYVFVEGMNPSGQTYGGGGRARYLLTETWVWVRYVGMFLAPTRLSPDTDLQLFTSPWDLRVAAGVLLALILFVALMLASERRESRAIAFGLAWFGLALVPSSTVFPLAEVANDHRVFFPFAGLSLATTAWLSRRFQLAAERRRASSAPVRVACALAVVVLAAHALGTYRRNRAWRTEETLWADCVRVSPHNGRAWMNYGLTQMEQGRYARAKELFLRATRFNPNYSTLEVNLAIVENALGNSAAADSHFTRALALNPLHPASHTYYARWLVQRGRAGEAVPHLEYAIRLSPADLEARHRLMGLYAARGAPELVRLARETLELTSVDTVAAAYARGLPPFRPDSADARGWQARGLSLIREDRYAEAAQAYRAALALDSTSADAENNLGWSLAKLGFYEDALPGFQSAIRHRPGFALAANNRAWAAGEVVDARFKRAFALQQTGRAEEAVEIYRGLLASHPRWVNAHYNLGHALMALGRSREAAAEFRRTLELQPDMQEARVNLLAAMRAAEAAPVHDARTR